MNKDHLKILNKLQNRRHFLGNLKQEKFWRIGEETGEFLQKLLMQIGAERVLEVGTSSGYSSLWILEFLLENSGHLWTIESHAERFKLGKETFELAGVSQLVTQIKGHAPEAIDELDESLSFDLVFIDATKYETQIHFEAAWKRLKKGGIIVIDNISTHRNKFGEFLKFLEKGKYEYYEKEIEAGLLTIIN